MAMSATTLATQLQLKVANTGTASTAISNITDAFDLYVINAVGNSVPLSRPSGVKPTMRAAMAALNTSGQGAAAIAAGVTAYWNQVISSPSASFPGAIAATMPTGLGSLAANLQAVFTANTNANLSANAALTAVANVIHTACQGGTVTLPPSNVGAIV